LSSAALLVDLLKARHDRCRVTCGKEAVDVDAGDAGCGLGDEVVAEPAGVLGTLVVVDDLHEVEHPVPLGGGERSATALPIPPPISAITTAAIASTFGEARRARCG